MVIEGWESHQIDLTPPQRIGLDRPHQVLQESTHRTFNLERFIKLVHRSSRKLLFIGR